MRASVSALTEGVSRTMFLTKLEMAVSTLVAAIVTVAGSGVLAQQASCAKGREASTSQTNVLGPTKATSPDPATATRQEKVVYGVTWGMSYEAALERAEVEDRPVLVHFAAITNANSRFMERKVLPHADVIPLLSRFV